MSTQPMGLVLLDGDGDERARNIVGTLGAVDRCELLGPDHDIRLLHGIRIWTESGIRFV